MRQLGECCDDLGDHALVVRRQAFAVVSDPTQTRRQLDLDAMRTGQVHRVLGMETEPHTLVGDVVAREAVVQQATGHGQQLGVQPPHDDPPKGTGLSPPKGRPIRVDHEAAVRVHPEGKAVAAEPVHRDRHIHMLHERSQTLRLVRVVQPRGEMDPQSRRMTDGVEGRARLLGGASGDLVRAPVL